MIVKFKYIGKLHIVSGYLLRWQEWAAVSDIYKWLKGCDFVQLFEKDGGVLFI